MNDITLRFKINFPVLFSNLGVDMIQTRTTLVRSPADAALLVDVEARLAMKVSPSLSAANNTAIMLAAVLHENLSTEKAQGWHEEFEKQLKLLCEWCTLSPKTIDRSRTAGKLMLRSNVIACMLPSFVVLLSVPIGVLLDDVERAQRLEGAFAEEMGRYANEFEVTRQVVIGPQKKLIEEGGVAEEAGQLLQIEEDVVVEKMVPTLKMCRKCKQMTERFLCDAGGGEELEHSFCWRCAGYSDRPPDELLYPGTRVSIHTYVFCPKHLPKLEWCTRPYSDYLKTKPDPPLSLPDFVSSVQADECRKVVEIFSGPACRFALEPMEPNGWCVFLGIASGLGEELEVLVGGLQGFVHEFVKTQRAFVKSAKRFLKLWQNVDVGDNSSVQELWSCDDGDLLMPLIGEYLNVKEKRAVQLCVWNVKNGKLHRMESYPNGEDAYQRVIHLLQTNVIVPHYDLMRPKK